MLSKALKSSHVITSSKSAIDLHSYRDSSKSDREIHAIPTNYPPRLGSHRKFIQRVYSAAITATSKT